MFLARVSRRVSHIQSLFQPSLVIQRNLRKIHPPKIYIITDENEVRKILNYYANEEENKLDFYTNGISAHIWKWEMKLSCFGENAKLCRYDRLPPYMESVNSNVCAETELDSYNIHYNIWKNILEFSVHSSISELKEEIQKLTKKDISPEDVFCCSMAIMIVRLTRYSKPPPIF